MCGAPPSNDHRETKDGEVRSNDIEPYVTLRYIARLFKVLAALMVVMLIGEVVTGLMMRGTDAVLTLLGEATRLLVLAGLMWGGGDIALLLIGMGHDLRVSRILLGRINGEIMRWPEQPDSAPHPRSGTDG
jgi:hypothetical protein